MKCGSSKKLHTWRSNQRHTFIHYPTIDKPKTFNQRFVFFALWRRRKIKVWTLILIIFHFILDARKAFLEHRLVDCWVDFSCFLEGVYDSRLLKVGFHGESQLIVFEFRDIIHELIAAKANKIKFSTLFHARSFKFSIHHLICNDLLILQVACLKNIKSELWTNGANREV